MESVSLVFMWEIIVHLGILVNENGCVYEGNWRNNFKHGVGLEYLKDKGIYFGQYVNGRPEGQGSFQWENQETYIGEWLEGSKVGRSPGLPFTGKARKWLVERVQAGLVPRRVDLRANRRTGSAHLGQWRYVEGHLKREMGQVTLGTSRTI